MNSDLGDEAVAVLIFLAAIVVGLIALVCV